MKPSFSQSRFDKAATAEQARDAEALSTARLSGGLDAPAISSSEWQRQYAKTLDHACRSVDLRLSHGQKPRRAFNQVARYYNGRSLGPNHHLHLAKSTLRNHFRKWKRGGEVPAVFRLHFHPRRSVFTSAQLVRFLNFFIEYPQRSRRQAWFKFARLGGNYGPGRRTGKPLKISQNQLHHNFPASWFRQIRAEQDALELAQKNIAILRQQFTSEIRERFPERTPRRRVRKELEFQT